LAAVAAVSSAFADNPASLAVSRALGYHPNGVGRLAPRGEPRDHLHLRLTRRGWQEHRHCEVKVTGLAECRDMFGV
jgi:RimJ/RimL family protein N-acetyltransferase